jgi:hypothetical protein
MLSLEDDLFSAAAQRFLTYMKRSTIADVNMEIPRTWWLICFTSLLSNNPLTQFGEWIPRVME